ncbi:MAG TPA: hypothetical protein VFQ65_06945 [Kofleriaceae bacterium]|nr:hypothetical protein [Kofleriaceae bacterium]
MTPDQHAIFTLCVGGEWACAHGDFAGLRDVARRLEDYVPEIRSELRRLETACRDDIDHASAIWVQVERRITASH